MIKYSDLDSGKKAFILELDNVLYPERDYLLQVYYLFANFIEFTETAHSSKYPLDFLKNSYELRGSNAIFSEASKLFGIGGKYEENFRKLYYTARLLSLNSNRIILMHNARNYLTKKNSEFISLNSKTNISFKRWFGQQSPFISL